MHTLPSPRLRYSTRPSSPFSSVGSNTPLMAAACTSVAPLMNKRLARALSWATALASAAACSAPCAKTKTSQRKQCAGGGGGGAQAAAANLTLRFSTRHHLHRRWGFNPASFAISNLPWARSAGFSCAAACNPREAISPAFHQHRLDLPRPSKVLHAHAAVAALAVQHTAVQPLLLWKDLCVKILRLLLR